MCLNIDAPYSLSKTKQNKTKLCDERFSFLNIYQKSFALNRYLKIEFLLTELREKPMKLSRYVSFGLCFGKM